MLIAAGWSNKAPTVWLAEGLLMYLMQKSSEHLLQDMAGQSAFFNPEMSISIQKRHSYAGNLNREMSGDSKNGFLHYGDVSSVYKAAVKLCRHIPSDSVCTVLVHSSTCHLWQSNMCCLCC